MFLVKTTPKNGNLFVLYVYFIQTDVHRAYFETSFYVTKILYLFIRGAEEETGEMMMVLIQDKRRLRKKHFGRLRRHLAPLDLHLWEKEMEEDDGTSKHGMAMLRQLSVGTSLSTSSITDCGLLPLYSDGDTTENTSEAPISLELQNRPMTR